MSSSEGASVKSTEKEKDKDKDVDKDAPVETVHIIKTNEQVPGHPGYYEKDGLRTYGDDEDHDHEPPVCFDGSLTTFRLTGNQMSFHRMMSLVAMAFLWIGSQIPVYIFGKLSPGLSVGVLLTSNRKCPTVHLQ
jgi:hypothetical protein